MATVTKIPVPDPRATSTDAAYVAREMVELMQAAPRELAITLLRTQLERFRAIGAMEVIKLFSDAPEGK